MKRLVVTPLKSFGADQARVDVIAELRDDHQVFNGSRLMLRLHGIEEFEARHPCSLGALKPKHLPKPLVAF